MTKGFHKKQSKRIPAKRRYKIEKKVREHNRKLKKELKRKVHRNRRKDPGIPNSLPFKEKILNDVQEYKKRNEELKEMMRIQAKQNRKNSNDKSKFAVNPDKNLELAELLKHAETRSIEFENRAKQEEYIVQSDVDDVSCSNSKTFLKSVHKVIEESDVIIEVLDARDPLGTRCFELEDHIHPCTQAQKQHLSSSKVNVLVSSDDLLKSSRCLGIDVLMKVLNKNCHSCNVKTSMTIGIIGFPNVGKSSVINSLKRSSVCNVAPTPGLTRSIQTVALDKKIKIIDSPGIVFAKNHSVSETESWSSILALRNALNVDQLQDPIAPIQTILNKVNRGKLKEIYEIDHFENVEQFLQSLAKRFGKISKGGKLDLIAVAKKILNDWNCGRIKYYTVPPDSSTESDVKLVDKFSEEFNLDSVTIKELMSIDLDPYTSKDSNVLALKSLTEIQTTSSKRSNQSQSSSNDNDVEMEDIAGMQLNKELRNRFKKTKKQKKKEIKLTNRFEQTISIDEDYDFNDYF
ncbi:guanine nucleotide-binding protein-like protein 3-like protein [Sarcoptes scabiei]|uniref:Guanine nucleotide-binding protein-like 3 homolog n=1 Tax=Sarcoptes scabiei TaxID=52283 RepID=A0A131ZVP9_SARSC|nr:guanine nucleotide-binding protein-like protein 3-like protein [Sarcoptes scabiei]